MPDESLARKACPISMNHIFKIERSFYPKSNWTKNQWGDAWHCETWYFPRYSLQWQKTHLLRTGAYCGAILGPSSASRAESLPGEWQDLHVIVPVFAFSGESFQLIAIRE